MITAWILLTTLLLIQARMPLAFLDILAHCWTMFSCCQPAYPSPFPPGSFPATLPIACSAAWDSFDPRAGPNIGLVESHTTGLSPSIQPVQTPLKSLSMLQQINTHTQLRVILKQIERKLDLLVRIISKD
ncbi:hypothetical protein BTVI_47663 [Pitangus sulphuratus]|nr:hypothetical protein BTVI_47663 [Pitangus sulphuratus]